MKTYTNQFWHSQRKPDLPAYKPPVRKQTPESKLSLNKKQCVESFNIDCLLAWEWPTTTGSPEKRRLTNARGSTDYDQWGVTTQSASDWLKQVSLWNYEYRKIIYVNCGVKNYLKEGHRSCEKKAWKTIQSCTGFEPLTSAMPVGSVLPIKLTSQLGAGRWVGS